MNFRFDLKYAWRLLRKSWGYSLMCASVVALSVGLAVWVWTLTYSQVIQPLPFVGSDRWYAVRLAPDATVRSRPSIDAYTYQELLKHNRSAEYLGAFAIRGAVLSEGEATTSLRASVISPRLLAAMRVPPLLGRTFAETDGQAEAEGVAILSFDTWQHYFAGDPAIVGKTARMDGKPVRIVGVMPQDFFAFQDSQVWQPLQLPKLAKPGDSTMTLSPLIVLRDKQNLNGVLSEMKAAVTAVNTDYPDLFNPARRVELGPAKRIYNSGSTPIVVMLSLMAVGVVLLGCLNISMVFLARLLGRSRELALRNALGASRSRLMRQCLLETALIVAMGLVAGYGLAAYGVQWTHGISSFGQRILANGRSSNLPMLRPLDLAIAVACAVMIWLLSTLIPAWRIARQDASSVLAGSGKGATSRGGNKSVGLLVGLQVVIACLVLVACGNVVMAVDEEVNKPSGIQTAGLMLSTNPTVLDTRFTDPAQRVRYWDELDSAIASKVPGVQVAFTTAPPSRPVRLAASIETQQGADRQGMLTLPLTVVSENYFKLLDIRLRSGRLFERTDDSASLKVAVVDEKMAARYWPGQNPIGKRIRLNSVGNDWLTIVGVVSNVRGAPYRPDADLGTLYQPLRQAAPTAFHILYKSAGAADQRPAIRAAAFAIDRELPLHNLQPFDDYVAAVNLSYPAMTKIFTVIALITAVLAASGLFGLISRSVAQRTQEVGIRRALGATRWRATSMFMRQGAVYLTVAIVGVTLGILVMPMLSRAFPNILERVVPVTAGVFVLMTAVISGASYLPTRRAVALEPGDALHYE